MTDELGEDGHGLRRADLPAAWSPSTPTSAERRAVGPAGLAAVVHPWETGMDNSPAWDAAAARGAGRPSLFDTYTRRDLDHAGTGERPTDEDYARYIRLALAYRDHGYDDDWVRAEGEFLVVDPASTPCGPGRSWRWPNWPGGSGPDPARHQAEAAASPSAGRRAVDRSETTGAFFLATDVRTEPGAASSVSERRRLPILVLPGLPETTVTVLVTP